VPSFRRLSSLLAGAALSATAPAAAPAALSGQPPSDAEYRTLCRSFGPQHVRALFRGAVAPIRLGGAADCAFSPRGGNPEVTGVKVFLRIDDGDRTLWAHHGDRPYGTFHWLSKTGRLSKWGYEGGRLPSIVDARHASFTCTLIPIGTAGLAIPGGPAFAAARTYAQRLLTLCDDVYRTYG